MNYSIRLGLLLSCCITTMYLYCPPKKKSVPYKVKKSVPYKVRIKRAEDIARDKGIEANNARKQTESALAQAKRAEEAQHNAQRDLEVMKIAFQAANDSERKNLQGKLENLTKKLIETEQDTKLALQQVNNQLLETMRREQEAHEALLQLQQEKERAIEEAQATIEETRANLARIQQENADTLEQVTATSVQAHADTVQAQLERDFAVAEAITAQEEAIAAREEIEQAVHETAEERSLRAKAEAEGQAVLARMQEMYNQLQDMARKLKREHDKIQQIFDQSHGDIGAIHRHILELLAQHDNAFTQLRNDFAYQKRQHRERIKIPAFYQEFAIHLQGLIDRNSEELQLKLGELQGALKRIQRMQDAAAADQTDHMNFQKQYEQVSRQFTELQDRMKTCKKGINVQGQQAQQLQWGVKSVQRMNRATEHIRRQGTYYLQPGEERLALGELLTDADQGTAADAGALDEDPMVTAAAAGEIVRYAVPRVIQDLREKIDRLLTENGGRQSLIDIINTSRNAMNQENQQREARLLEGRTSPTPSCDGEDGYIMLERVIDDLPAAAAGSLAHRELPQ